MRAPAAPMIIMIIEPAPKYRPIRWLNTGSLFRVFGALAHKGDADAGSIGSTSGRVGLAVATTHWKILPSTNLGRFATLAHLVSRTTGLCWLEVTIETRIASHSGHAAALCLAIGS